MQYLLTDEEYSMLQGMSLHIEQLQNENDSLRQELADAKSGHRSLVRQRNHYQREFEDCLCANRGLAKQSVTLQAQITEMKRDFEGTTAHAKQSIKERDERIEALRKENESLSHKLAVANETREKDRQQIKSLSDKLESYRKTYDTMNSESCRTSESIVNLRKLNAEHEGKIAALESALRDKEELLKLIPEDVLITAKLKRLVSLGKQGTNLSPTACFLLFRRR